WMPVRASSSSRSSRRRPSSISGPSAGEDLVEMEVLGWCEGLVDRPELLDLSALQRHRGGQHALTMGGMAGCEVVHLAAQRVGGTGHRAGSPLPRPGGLLEGALGGILEWSALGRCRRSD